MATKPKGTLNIILVGKTGSGKSSTGNTVLRRSVFNTSDDFGSDTSECSLQKGTFHGWDLNLMDTPGLFDTDQSLEETGVIIVKAVVNMHPGSDAVLYVIRYGNRYTDEEYSSYNRFKMLFGSDVTNHMIILFTGGDNVHPGTDFDQTLKKAPKKLRDVLDDSNWRYVIFNNKKPDSQDQLQRLFDKIEELRNLNGGRPYVCSSYSKIGDTMDAQVGKRVQEIKEQEAKANEYIQELEQTLLQKVDEMNLSKENHEKKVAAVEEKLRQEREERERKHLKLEASLQREREERDYDKRLHELERNLLAAKEGHPISKFIPSGETVATVLETLVSGAKEIAIAYAKK